MSKKDIFDEFPKPQRRGFRLTPQAEENYECWRVEVLAHDGCYCYGDRGPCSVCAHDGHPEVLFHDPESWEKDEIDFLAINKEFASK